MDKIEARYYDKHDDRQVKCRLCPVSCNIGPGKQGICMVRTNEDGILYSSEYGKTIALNIDPIEKKPLYHFKPGSQILSIGPNGCNFGCVFCQNWNISQVQAQTTFVAPDDLVKLSKTKKSVGVAFTYTEPLVWFEYIYDSASLLRQAGISAVLVSNGYTNEEPARELFKYIDAANFDLKSIRPEFYRRYCKGKLADVQRTIEIAKEMDVHVELTNLLIPGMNDSNDEINDLIDWVYQLDPKTVIHFSRYFPNYKLDIPATPEERLLFAYNNAKEKLNYVYVGNIVGIAGSDTLCPACGASMIRRNGYYVNTSGLDGNKCAKCGAVSDIVA